MLPASIARRKYGLSPLSTAGTVPSVEVSGRSCPRAAALGPRLVSEVFIEASVLFHLHRSPQMLGQLAETLSSVCRHNARHTGQESARQCPSKANDFSARFNRNSATPEITKQAAERKRSSQGAAFYELPPNCRQPLPWDYFRVASDSGTEWWRSSALETERPHLNRGCSQV